MATPALHPHPPLGVPTLCWRRAFPGRAEQAAHARRFTAFLLADHPKADDAVLAVGELAANAVQHTLSRVPQLM
jgi:hypothetical protein